VAVPDLWKQNEIIAVFPSIKDRNVQGAFRGPVKQRKRIHLHREIIHNKKTFFQAWTTELNSVTR
jgi:hypothetical protein